MSIKKISKQALCLLLGTGLYLTACKKEPQKVSQQQGVTKRLLRVTEDAANYSTFSYNTNGTLRKMTQTSNEGGPADSLEILYTYNDQKKVTGFAIAGSVNFKYIYSDNKITKVELYSNTILGGYDLFTYTGEKITKMEKYFRGTNASFELDSKSDCSYYADGNLKEIKTFFVDGSGQLVHTITRQYLQYDSKKSPFSEFGEANIGLFLDFLSLNNIARLKNLNADGTIILDNEISYTYSADGYPLTSTTKSTENGIVTNSTSTFTYE